MARLLSALVLVLALVSGVGAFSRDYPPSYAKLQPTSPSPEFSPTYLVEWTTNGEHKVYTLHGGNEVIVVHHSWYTFASPSFLSWTCIGTCDVDPEKNFATANVERRREGMSEYDVVLLAMYRDKGRGLARKQWPEAFENK